MSWASRWFWPAPSTPDEKPSPQSEEELIESKWTFQSDRNDEWTNTDVRNAAAIYSANNFGG